VVVLAGKMARRGHRLYLTGLHPEVQDALMQAGLAGLVTGAQTPPQILPDLDSLRSAMAVS
jgi:hypothetical protein